MSGLNARRPFRTAADSCCCLRRRGGRPRSIAGQPSVAYLALHGHDPVAWQEWNADTLARARRENKLLFVSVGYFACHWCHVMQRESYQNPQIAALLNRDFIPVKVDRELNNGLDEALQDFSSLLNGVAGWPLNAFVTPEGYPVFVVLYAPPDDFRKLLPQLSARWASDPAASGVFGAAGGTAARAGPASCASDGRTQRTRLAAVRRRRLAGSRHAARRLRPSRQISAGAANACLAGGQARQTGRQAGEFLRLSIDQMAARWLRDHIGGGFFRYNTRIPDGTRRISRKCSTTMRIWRCSICVPQPCCASRVTATLPACSSISCRTNCWIRVVACTAAPRRWTPPGGKAPPICGNPMN